MQNRVKELVEQLDLQEHVEGGFYKETYRSKGIIKQGSTPENFDGDRNYSTGIYFLLTSDNFSAFHRIKQDEMWHFYEGSPLTIHMIDVTGHYSFQRLGLDLKNHEQPQFTVPKNVWFASEVEDPNTYCLTGCTVAPGFDFTDFELAERKALIKAYPQHKEVIHRLTRF
ncbi:MAG: cupin domain-containing protein [Balneolaceae bacterium]|nr:cupin domain-containing protein [Balneolaceae bacterium]MBO6547694.1 cupin domain-containing protein [Balneolaceae bacterium]MBO6648205.1 cupin domain-containing protein [Balneolaceae bacterium]